ncbi:MAG TPA: hypothetical protein VGB29_00605, partial [Thermodesulfobacteriota bacterium]
MEKRRSTWPDSTKTVSGKTGAVHATRQTYQKLLTPEYFNREILVEAIHPEWVQDNQIRFKVTKAGRQEYNILLIHQANMAEKNYQEANDLKEAGNCSEAIRKLRNAITSYPQPRHFTLWVQIIGDMLDRHIDVEDELQNHESLVVETDYFRGLSAQFKYSYFLQLGDRFSTSLGSAWILDSGAAPSLYVVT